MRQCMCVVLMGICGCGKSTVGSALAQRLGWRFYDADAFHSQENVARMRRGVALNDEQRGQWLDDLREHITRLYDEGVRAVIACSALKKAYRRVLSAHEHMHYVYLHISKAEAQLRMKRRENHFMPPSLVQSQLNVLEVPQESEGIRCTTVSAERSLEEIVRHCVPVCQ